VHFGRATTVLAEREQVLRAAYDRHPERFVHGLPRVAPLPSAVWINPPTTIAAPTIFTHEHSLIS